MNEEEKQWLLAKLDWFFDLSNCIIRYFRQHTDISFDVAKETYVIAKIQLRQFVKDHYMDIYEDESLYNYYDCVMREMQFIDDNLANL